MDLIDQLSSRWLRITLKVGSFFLVGYFTLVNVWFRNVLIGLLTVLLRRYIERGHPSYGNVA